MAPSLLFSPSFQVAVLVLLPLLLQPSVAPGAHIFGSGRKGRDLWARCRPGRGCTGSRNEAEAKLDGALFDGSNEQRDRIQQCMTECYDPDSNCAECRLRCVDKCVDVVV